MAGFLGASWSGCRRLSLLNSAQLHKVSQAPGNHPSFASHMGGALEETAEGIIQGLRQVTGSAQIQRDEFQRVKWVTEGERAQEGLENGATF